MKLLIRVLLLCLLAPGVSAEIRDAEKHFFDQSLGDFSEELEIAREQGKKGVLLFFEMDDCPFCHRMKHSVLNQSYVQDYFHENFLIFAVDIEGETEMTTFDGRVLKQKEYSVIDFRVRATPVFVFFDLQGKPTTRFVGPVTSIDEFMLLGDYVVKGRYNEMSFLRYKREHTSLLNKHADIKQ